MQTTSNNLMQGLAKRSHRLLIFGFLIALVVPTTLSLATLRSDRQRFSEQAAIARLSLAHTVAADIDRVTANGERAARAIAASSAVIEAQTHPEPEALAAALVAARQAFPQVRALAIADLEGRIKGSIPLEAANWLAKPSDHPSTTLVELPEREMAVEMRVPILDQSNNSRSATLVLALPLHEFFEPLRVTRFGETGAIVLRSQDGKLLMPPDEAQGSVPVAMDSSLWSGRREAALTLPARFGQSAMLLAFAQTDLLPLVVTVTESRAEALTKPNVFARLLISADVLLMLMGILLVALSARSHKKFETLVSETRGTLAALMDNVSDAVFITDLDGRFSMVNSAAAALVGVSVEKICGTLPEDYFDAASIATFGLHDKEALASGNAWRGEETLRRNDRTHTFRVLRSAVRSSEGVLTGTLTMLRVADD